MASLYPGRPRPRKRFQEREFRIRDQMSEVRPQKNLKPEL